MPPMRLLSMLAMFTALAGAEPASAKSDAQYWQSLQLRWKVGNRVVLTNDTVMRTSDSRGRYQIANHLMAAYKLDKHWSVALGYTADLQYNHSSYTTMENRFRQDVAYDGLLTIGKAKISARLRLEERWRDGFAGTGWRLRPYVKIAIPLPSKLALNLSHESFVDLNTPRFQKVPGLERMRNAMMLERPINRHFSLGLGYVEQHGFVPGGEDTDDHVATMQISASF